MNKKSVLTGAAAVICVFALTRCGGDNSNSNNNSNPGTQSYSPTTVPLGNFKVSCGTTPAQQSKQAQQQVSYQQQQQQLGGGSCTPQLQFVQSVATNFNVHLDCDKRQVQVTGLGLDQPSAFLPIQNNGNWRGQVVLQQQIQNDGHGNMYCRVKTIVNFDGTAQCGLPQQQGLNWATQVSFAQAGSAGASSAGLIRTADTPVADPVPGGPLPVDSTGPVDPVPSASLMPGETPTSGVSTPVSTDASPLSEPSASPAPSATPSASPSTCTFGAPQSVTADTLTIQIPDQAPSLGCQAFGSRPYQVYAGTRVKWVNNDTQAHTITADDGSFDSGQIAPGDSYSHVFDQQGAFTYHSDLDPQMQGLIVVLPASARPSPIPSATFTVTPPPSPSASASPSPVPSVSPAPSVSPSPSPTVVPLPTPSPSPSPVPSVSPSPSVTPSPRPSVSPSPFVPLPPPTPFVPPTGQPTPSITQVTQCVVVNPCPIVTKVQQPCPSAQQQ